LLGHRGRTEGTAHDDAPECAWAASQLALDELTVFHAVEK
jgi:hypothetical protein